VVDWTREVREKNNSAGSLCFKNVFYTMLKELRTCGQVTNAVAMKVVTKLPASEQK